MRLYSCSANISYFERETDIRQTYDIQTYRQTSDRHQYDIQAVRQTDRRTEVGALKDTLPASF